MKKILGLVAALALAAPYSASAQTFASTPGTYTFSGSGVLVQKGSGPLLTCDLSVDITNSGGVITASNTSLTGFFGLCNTVVFLNEPYAVTVSGSNVSFSAVYADTTITPGDCAGTLTATFSAGPPETLTVNTTLPEVGAGTGNCTINGAITW